MSQDTVWTEKYRPREISEVSLEKGVREVFAGMIKNARSSTGKEFPPNLLLYGPPGSGKTTLALILARALAHGEGILELNASSDRDIATIRGRVKAFAQTKSPEGEVKLVIMDECEYLTAEAQHCLRRIIEDTQAHTRFIFITNYIARIIDPIRSRLTAICIEGGTPHEKKERIKAVAAMEGVPITEDEVVLLLSSCGFDLRKAIILLQTLSRCALSSGGYAGVISELVGSIPPSLVASFLSTKTAKEVHACVEAFVRQGHSSLMLVRALSSHIVSSPSHHPRFVSKALRVLSQYEERLVLGGNDRVQLLGLGLELIERLE